MQANAQAVFQETAWAFEQGRRAKKRENFYLQFPEGYAILSK